MKSGRGSPTGLPRLLTCPCRGEPRNTRRDTPLLSLEEGLRTRNADPWQRAARWSVERAQQGQAQLMAALDQLDADHADRRAQIAGRYARLGSLAKVRTYFSQARKRARSEDQKSAIDASTAAL